MHTRLSAPLGILFAFVILMLCRVEAQGGNTNQPARAALKLAKEQAAAEAKEVGLEGPEDVEFKGTIFNDQEVPPIIDLSGKTFEEDIADGYWLVDAFSPYCGHCKSLAPKLQTLYEFYYTSDPLPATPDTDSKTSLNSFSRYYNIKFAKLDCVAFGTACSNLNVGSFPTLILFKDGKEVKKSTGDREMVKLSAFIEECLEIIRPGSRPVGGLPELPTVGVNSFSTDKVSVLGEAGTTKPSGLLTQSKRPINPDGISEDFNPDNFTSTVTKSLDTWFIKFYAPWCPHCQRMAPSWKGMAREMKGKLNVGEVNCEVEKKLCRQMGINSYPMLKVIRGSDQVDYEGLRGVGDLVHYAEEIVAATSSVKDVTLEEFEVLEKEEEVVFVYFYDHATTTEDFMAIERLPIKLIEHAKLVKTSDAAMVKRFKITTWPRLVVSRKGRVTVFDKLMPQNIRNIDEVSHWMQSVWLPLVPELTATNAKELMRGKYVVLAILDRSRKETFAVAQRELETAAIEWMERQDHQFELQRQELRDAKQLRIEEAQDRNDERAEMRAKQIRVNTDDLSHQEVAFAWVDGVFWDRWVRKQFGISVQEGEKVVVNDQDNARYWDTTVTGNPIVPSRTSILETLARILASPPKLAWKPSGTSIAVYYYRAMNSIKSHPMTSMGVAAVVLLGLIAFFARRRRRRSDYASAGYFEVSGSVSNGLLGGNKGD